MSAVISPTTTYIINGRWNEIDQRKKCDNKIADLLVALLLESRSEVGGHLAERIAGCIADSGMLETNGCIMCHGGSKE